MSMPVPAGARRSSLGWLAFALRSAAFLPILAGCVYVFAFMPSPPAIAVLSAVVESMSFRVTSPELGRISLRGYALSYEAPIADLGFGANRVVASRTTQRALCLEGLVTPALDTRVTYERFGTAPAAIEMRRDDGQPIGAFEIIKGQLPDAVRKASWIRLVAKDEEEDTKSSLLCPGASMTRLPVFGFAEIGSELRPAATGGKASFGTLLEGSLDVFARTIELRTFEPRIYAATSGSVTIPAGSKLSVEARDEEARPWAGFVIADRSDGAGLDVRVSTEARVIRLVRPGGGPKPETMAVGLFAQLTNDPVLMQAQVGIAFLFAAFRFFGSVAGWADAKRAARARGS